MHDFFVNVIALLVIAVTQPNVKTVSLFWLAEFFTNCDRNVRNFHERSICTVGLCQKGFLFFLTLSIVIEITRL